MTLKHIALIVSLIVLSSACFADTPKMLTDYQDVIAAVRHGGHVQSVSDLNTCSPAIGDAIQLGTVSFDHFLVYSTQKDGKMMNVIGTSNTILINKKGIGYCFEYIKMRIFSDNSVEVSSQYLSPKDYAPIDNKPASSVTCHLNNKKDSLSGVTLYG